MRPNSFALVFKNCSINNCSSRPLFIYGACTLLCSVVEDNKLMSVPESLFDDSMKEFVYA